MKSKVITKSDLTNQISKQLNLTNVNVSQIIQLLINNITDHLAEGNEIALRNFGTFDVRVMRARLGRNPNAPENSVAIPPKTAVKFTPGKELRNKVLDLTAEIAPEKMPKRRNRES